MDVLRVILDELLDTVPKSWDGLDVLVQAEDEAVLLPVFLHESEWVVVDVAEQLNARLHTPVVFEVHHHRMTEEKAGFIPTHVPVTDRVAVDDLPLPHVFTNSLCLFLVDPLWETPVLGTDLAIMSLTRNKSCGHLLEIVIERLVVQEDPGIIVVAVKPIFHLADGSCYFPQI